MLSHFQKCSHYPDFLQAPGSPGNLFRNLSPQRSDRDNDTASGDSQDEYQPDKEVPEFSGSEDDKDDDDECDSNDDNSKPKPQTKVKKIKQGVAARQRIRQLQSADGDSDDHESPAKAQ